MTTALAQANPQLIPTTSGVPSFPTSTSPGVTTAPATGAVPQLVPTVGSSNASASPNTPIPGSTAPAATAAPAKPAVPTPAPAPLTSALPPPPPATPAPPISSIPTTLTPDQTVAGQLNKDLTSGSPYLDLARSQSLQAASARGLQNSSIAAGAGEAAAISAALPIAQQDATTAATAAGQVREGEINFALQAQTEEANIKQIWTQGNVNSMLSEQQSAEQINQINATSANAIKQIQAQAAANASQDGPALQAQYLTGVTNIMTATQAQIQAIYQTTGLSPQQQQAAVLTANQQMQENINSLAAYYASSPLWLTGQNPAPIPPGSIPKQAQPSPIAPQVQPRAPNQPRPATPVTPALIPPGRGGSPFAPGVPVY